MGELRKKLQKSFEESEKSFFLAEKQRRHT